MASSRTIVIVGAGIGGLTAALMLARKGFHISLIDQAERLEETGAGIQLTPNATRILIELGLGQRLKSAVVVPAGLRIIKARSGRDIVRMPLGPSAELRYGTPYWVIHRGDLQAALLEAVRRHPDVDLVLGTKVVDCTAHSNGVTVAGMRARGNFDGRGTALIGADGLWSTVRTRLGDKLPPRFAGRTAWRAVVPAEAVAPEWREPFVNLWLGRRGHLVHYPVKAGNAINIVAIASDAWTAAGWSAPGTREEVLQHFPRRAWAGPAQELLAAPDRWLKWALADRAPIRHFGRGPVTLLGDAAHPMLPFLAQGAAMAIEDAAVLADCMAKMPGDPQAAMGLYERARRTRTARVQRESRKNARLYQLRGPIGLLRNIALRALGGKRLLSRYDWIYGFMIGGRPDTKRNR
jgi:salicylate hydroxylase